MTAGGQESGSLSAQICVIPADVAKSTTVVSTSIVRVKRVRVVLPVLWGDETVRDCGGPSVLMLSGLFVEHGISGSKPRVAMHCWQNVQGLIA